MMSFSPVSRHRVEVLAVFTELQLSHHLWGEREPADCWAGLREEGRIEGREYEGGREGGREGRRGEREDGVPECP